MKHHAPLDGLRAIAVSAVVIYHLSGSLLPGGWIGVDIFFVLSGFLITRILLAELKSAASVNLGAFYTRRFLRLMPAFWLMLICTSALYVMSPAARMTHIESAWTSAIYLMNWNRAFSWFGDDGGYLGHTWSLATEEQFYLLWPFLLMALFRVRRIAPAIILGLAAASLLWRMSLLQHGANVERAYNGFDTHADSILMGCALGFVRLSPRLARVASLTSTVPVLILGLLFLKADLWMKLRLEIGITAGAICAAWMIAASFSRGYFSAFLSWRPLVYTGQISYGWYLWHLPFLYLASKVFHIPDRFVFVPLSYGVAALSYHVVERPILSLRDRFRPTSQSEEAGSALA
ncbi:MAG TPA: acyltransferase [Acidocella sp.]|jgi:peptidoglycan/LPS O-acetylase OafA/YrhL|nr:acyltransferase [Acidocella sp.]